MKLQVKKTIALSLVGSYILMSMFGMFKGISVPTEFVTCLSLIIGYYFGKGSTD